MIRPIITVYFLFVLASADEGYVTCGSVIKLRNNYDTLKGKCKRGEAIKCGDKIRLMHLTTKCLLHSHMFNAPLSRGNQEVSCFGKNGEGDTGDHWIVTCNTDEWLRGEPVRFKHEDTGKFLASSGQQYGRPISGQGEVVGVSSPGNSAYWKTSEGVYMIKSKEANY
ncbi:Stromal cell-derived factor 2 [Toxocara canis]|uniref:Stromal cell-derived factor 2 n=1 Tax=Toxocara canis TaxID=6265 RepID=A0A0B2VGK0_TOXCA|nr:Stromal cell-derived factor 2 [Toxocara canis]